MTHFTVMMNIFTVALLTFFCEGNNAQQLASFGVANSYGIACADAVAIKDNAIVYGNIVSYSNIDTGDSSIVVGNIDTTRDVSVGINSKFNGTIISQATTYLYGNRRGVSEGIFTGDILSAAAVTVGARGRVVGNIYTRLFTLLTGGSVTGQVFQLAAGDRVPSSNITRVLADIGNAYTYLIAQPGTNDLEASIINNALVPGIYFHSGAWAFGSGRTLTFQGTSSDTWMIHINGAAAIGGNIYCVGALPSNIQWAVDGAISVGAGRNFCGDIVSPAAVALDAGATLHGSMYSLGGACSVGAGATFTKN